MLVFCGDVKGVGLALCGEPKKEGPFGDAGEAGSLPKLSIAVFTGEAGRALVEVGRGFAVDSLVGGEGIRGGRPEISLGMHLV